MLDSLGEITSHGARTYGDKAALVINGRSFSFTEIDHLACQLANGLKAKGVEPGDRVTLYAQNCWEWVVSYHEFLDANSDIVDNKTRGCPR